MELLANGTLRDNLWTLGDEQPPLKILVNIAEQVKVLKKNDKININDIYLNKVFSNLNKIQKNNI